MVVHAPTLFMTNMALSATLAVLQKRKEIPGINQYYLVTGFLMLMAKERADERNRNLAMRDELAGLVNRRC